MCYNHHAEEELQRGYEYVAFLTLFSTKMLVSWSLTAQGSGIRPEEFREKELGKEQELHFGEVFQVPAPVFLTF